MTPPKKTRERGQAFAQDFHSVLVVILGGRKAKIEAAQSIVLRDSILVRVRSILTERDNSYPPFIQG